MGLSAIPRGGKSIPALGGGARHPRQQAASLPGERGGRIHRWQGSRAGRGRQPGKGILFSPRLSGCQRRWMHLEHSTDSLRPAASPSGDPQPACCKHTHSTRMQARVREDIYLRNNSLAKELSLVAGESGLQPAHLLTPGYLVIHGFIFSFRQTPLFPPCHSVHEEFGSKMAFSSFSFTQQLLPLHGGGKMQQPPAWSVQTVGREVAISSPKPAAVPGLCGSGEGLLKAACVQTRAALSYRALKCMCPTPEVFTSFTVSPVTAWSWYQHFLT